MPTKKTKRAVPIVVGEFTTTTGTMRISDPCYDKKTWCAGVLRNCLPGHWAATVWRKDMGNDDVRVTQLVVKNVHLNQFGSGWIKSGIDVGVDSGQCGVFEDKLYKKDLKKPLPLLGVHEELAAMNRHQLKRAKEMLAKVKKDPKSIPLPLEYVEQSVRAAQYSVDFDKKGTWKKPVEYTKDFYEACCDLTSTANHSGVLEYGAVSRSGYGDGGYECLYRTDKAGKIVEIKIVYIGRMPSED